jgi:hypothetical protein
MPDLEDKQQDTVDKIEDKKQEIDQEDQPDKVAAMQEELKTLKSHLEKIINEKRQEREKFKIKVDEEKKKQLEVKAETKEEYEQMLADYKKELQIRDDEIRKRDEAAQKMTLKNTANELAGKLTKDTKRAKVLAGLIAKRIKVTDEGTKVLNEKKELTISTVDSLLNEMKNEYAFLCDGLNSSGSGSTGNKAPAAGPTSLKELGAAERKKLYLENREKYNQLKNQK